MKTAGRIVAKAYLWLILLVIYAPIVFIAIFSFTEAKSLGNWTGFTFNLYESLFTGATSNSAALLVALKNTVVIALVASLISTILGTLAAIGIFNLSGRKRRAIQFLNNIPMLNPDIITGVSLFLLFVFLHVTKGYTTIILAHVTFCTPKTVLRLSIFLTSKTENYLNAHPSQFPMK